MNGPQFSGSFIISASQLSKLTPPRDGTLNTAVGLGNPLSAEALTAGLAKGESVGYTYSNGQARVQGQFTSSGDQVIISATGVPSRIFAEGARQTSQEAADNAIAQYLNAAGVDSYNFIR